MVNAVVISGNFMHKPVSDYKRPIQSAELNKMNNFTSNQTFDAAVKIVRRLHEAGHVAYLAGGCVRDALLGQQPKDYDVATDATPEVVRSLFKRTQAVGEAFGVVLVRNGSRERPIQTEVATFRREWGYADGRRPDHIEFSDAEHDARRRDFTVNALFADVTKSRVQRPESKVQGVESRVQGPRSEFVEKPVEGVGVVIDYVGGLADLEARQIRAVGEANERFGEDYLRMVRAVRFAARLDFTIEPTTAAAIGPLAEHLSRISRERIGQELEQMLIGPRPAEAARLTQSLGLDGAVLNEPSADPALPTLERLALPHDQDGCAYPLSLAAWMLDRHASGVVDGSESTSHAAENASSALEAAVRFARNYADQVIKRWRQALCQSNQTSQCLQGIFRALAQAHDWPRLGVAARKRALAQPIWPGTLRLVHALDLTRGRMIEHDASPLYEEGVAPTPLVSGTDLIALGQAPGPAFQTRLEAAYDRQLDGRLTNRRQALDWLANQCQVTPE